MTPLRLATAGIGLVGVSFGMARYGYGLLLPDIRRAFGLGPAALGLIGTGAYAAYLAATALAAPLSARAGPRATAVAGGLLAAAGMTVVALAAAPWMLAAGILVGGASAALCYPPFSDGARALRGRVRERVLGAIGCGTGYGVALAAPIAILAGAQWRHAWLAFAVLALVATAWAARALPARSTAQPERRGWQALARPGMLPLSAAAVLLGAGSAPYWTFAVAHLADAGASPHASRAFLAAVGVASVLGTVVADAMRLLGPARAYALFAALEAASVVLLAAQPGSPAAAFGSALLFGAAYNATVGAQALAAARLVPERPSLPLATVMGANGAGLLLGPVASGAVAEAAGLGAVLALGAVPVLVSALLYAGAVRRPSASRATSATASAASPTPIHSGSR